MSGPGPGLTKIALNERKKIARKFIRSLPNQNLLYCTYSLSCSSSSCFLHFDNEMTTTCIWLTYFCKTMKQRRSDADQTVPPLISGMLSSTARSCWDRVSHITAHNSELSMTCNSPEHLHKGWRQVWQALLDRQGAEYLRNFSSCHSSLRKSARPAIPLCSSVIAGAQVRVGHSAIVPLCFGQCATGYTGWPECDFEADEYG
jgi:hypothetical protein